MIYTCRAIFFVLAICKLLVFTSYHVHHFQLNGYRFDQYVNYLRGPHFKWVTSDHYMMVMGLLLGSFGQQAWIVGLGSVFILLAWYMGYVINTSKPVKKALNPTPRVIRQMVTISLLLAAAFTGLFYVKSYYVILVLLGLEAITPLLPAIANMINYPIEASIRQNFKRQAKKKLKECPELLTIGITGSYGKTSTKTVLNTVLNQHFNTLMSPGSFNTPMGLTITVNRYLKRFHQVFIAEMGAKELGEIKELMQLVKPQWGLITSIGHQHLETFGSFENIIKTKGEVFEYLPKGGTAFVNGQDENVVNQPRRDDVTYLIYGFDPSFDYYASNIKYNANGSSFTFHTPDGDTCDVRVKLLGQIHLLNVVAALSMAHRLGVATKELGFLVTNLEQVEHRLSIRTTPGTYTVLDDAFNSNPVGSKAALDVLRDFEGDKKIIMTPGMIELGDMQEHFNYEFGKHMKGRADYVVLVGETQTEPIQRGLADSGFPTDKLFIVKSTKDGFAKLGELAKEGDVVLLENDLPDTFNE